MNYDIWLVVIASCGGMFAISCVFLYLRLMQLRERLLLNQHGKESMKLEFRQTAQELFDEISSKFTIQSEKKIGDILYPLSQRIGEFQKNIDEKFTNSGKEQHSLKSEIARIINVNEQMRLQTENLSKALRGDVKAQGNWGEVMLERILSESGLIKNIDYVVQAEEMKLKGEDGGRLRPDVIVKLPDEKHIIIDSKVSLTAYERYCRAEDSANAEGAVNRDLHLREFVKSIKNHVTTLEAKRYQDIDKLKTPDFVFMFLPIEGAFSLALQYDSELHSFAWGRKVAIVCPSTLFASLMTIASLWRIERQNKNAQEIARQAGALYDKFVSFIGDMQEIGDRLSKAHNAYDNAMNKLSTGHGNITSRVEKLKSLGAKTTKSLPKEIVDNNEIDSDETENAAA